MAAINTIPNLGGLTEKTNLHANDLFLIEDSEASDEQKKAKHK